MNSVAQNHQTASSHPPPSGESIRSTPHAHPAESAFASLLGRLNEASRRLSLLEYAVKGVAAESEAAEDDMPLLDVSFSDLRATLDDSYSAVVEIARLVKDRAGETPPREVKQSIDESTERDEFLTDALKFVDELAGAAMTRIACGDDGPKSYERLAYLAGEARNSIWAAKGAE